MSGKRKASDSDGVILPNQSIYINNLNDKVHKDELKRSLYLLFIQFGGILDVVALKTPKMRGQAFIVFKDITSATMAMRALQSFVFFGKPMKISYAKSKSYAFMKEEGTYQKFLASQRRKAAGKGPASASLTEPATKQPKLAERTGVRGEKSTLYISNLPAQADQATLQRIFIQFEGLVEVRRVEVRGDSVCFAEYQTHAQADVARKNMDGFSLTIGSDTKEIKVELAAEKEHSFTKKN